MTVVEFRQCLQTAPMAEQVRLLAKLMQEARDTDVWKFTSLAEILPRWPVVVAHLDCHRGFWEFLLTLWGQEGLISN
jgi:hypothetical protein